MARIGAPVWSTGSPFSPPAAIFASAARAIARTDADMVVLLTDWMAQLDLLAAAESVGTALPVTGFPWAAAQTRWFYGASRQAAPDDSAGRSAPPCGSRHWTPMAREN